MRINPNLTTVGKDTKPNDKKSKKKKKKRSTETEEVASTDDPVLQTLLQSLSQAKS
jgi:hypothetical protein